jgi:exodeoxyribonuclease VII large subunit
VAGRLVVPDLAQLLERLDRSRAGLERGTRRTLERERQRLGRAHERLGRAPRLLVERRRAKLEQSAGRLRALSPKATLDRGYAIVRAREAIVRSGREVAPGERVEVELAEGGFDARVEETR